MRRSVDAERSRRFPSPKSVPISQVPRGPSRRTLAHAATIERLCLVGSLLEHGDSLLDLVGERLGVLDEVEHLGLVHLEKHTGDLGRGGGLDGVDEGVGEDRATSGRVRVGRGRGQGQVRVIRR